MFDIWRKNRQLKEKEIELSIREHDLAIKTLNSVLEARNEITDSDVASGWELLGSTDTQMSEKSHKDMLTAAYQLYHTNPHARAIIRSLVKFTLGKGPTLIPEEEDNKKVKEVWEKFKKENKFNKREKELAMRLFRDGEFFLRKFVDKLDGTTKVRFIRANRIAAPIEKQTDPTWSYGIKTDPEDIETPLKYCLVDNEGKQKEIIDASEIIHEKILADSDQKRGISVLRVSAKRIRQYDEWLEDRIVLNKVRSAVALIRNVDSSNAKVSDIRSENLSDRFSSTRKKQKMLNRGTIITASKGVTYEMLSPKIQASDVVEDGRSILLAIAAASGLPEMLFTSDYSNANYSSTLVAQNPFVREIEDWQDFLECFYKELFETVIENAKEHGKLPKDVSTECRVDFPPMIQAELDKLAKAFEVLYKYKIVSKKTWRGRMGLDDDVEKMNIENEEGDETYLPGMPVPGQPPQPGQPAPGKGPQPGQKSPFNMPIAPINQYSSEVMQAIREADWDKVIEIADKIEKLEKKSSVKKLAEERICKIAEEDPDFCNEIDDFPDENFLWVDEDGNRFFPYRDGCGDVVKAALVGALSVIDGHEDELPEEVLSKLEDLLKEYSIDKENITESDYVYECVGGKGSCGTGAGAGKGSSKGGGKFAPMAGTQKQVLAEAKARGLVVPPAWTDVKVSKNKNSDLQVTGRDSKGRKQYIYSAEHSEKASAEKFSRLRDFVGAKPKIDAKVARDFDKVEEAKVLSLISKTGFRIGSDGDTKAKVKAYGASTLRSEHVKIKGDTISFKFTGKKGVLIEKTITDKPLARALSGKTGRLMNTSDDKVRDYLKSIDGDFKVKDYRTYTGTATAIRTIKSMPKPTSDKERAKAISHVSKVVAKELGNTPTVAKKSYIAPEVWTLLGD